MGIDFRNCAGGAWIALAFAGLLALTSPPDAQERAAPVTGPDVTTIGGISPGARVNVRSGPSTLFAPVGTIAYGTRVRTGVCLGSGSGRWCQIEAYDSPLRGFVSARFLVQGSATAPGGDDALDGGPDYWAVRGLPAGDRLNVRRDPSASSPALATLSEGEVVQNMGCRMNGNSRWCRIRSITGINVTGWVAGRYLREAAGPGLPPGGGGAGASGPDFYVVTGLPAGRQLGLRTKPSSDATVIAQLATGTRLQNLGCEQRGQTRWCRVRTTGSISATGWVNGQYLREG